MKDPYVYDGSNVLINLANIKEQDKLDDYETTLSRIAIVELLKNPIDITLTKDIFEIHKRLFKEVYSWAGKPRTINIYKTEPVLGGLSVNYSEHNQIMKDLNKIQNDIDSFDLVNSKKKEVLSKLVRIISNIWQVHAFREDNTRTKLLIQKTC